MKTSLALWDEIEKSTGREIIVKMGMLDFGPKDSEDMLECIKVCERNKLEGKHMTSKEMMEKWSDFNFPENYIGYWTEEAGVVKVKETFKAF